VAPTIGRITTGGVITKYVLPVEQGFPFLITSGPDGALWFTNPYDNYSVGRITTSGVSTIIPIGAPCRNPNNPFNGIVRGDDGDLWLSCSNGGIVQISVPDTTPPIVTLQLTPKSLWPPNGKMVPVTVSGTITDTGSGVNAGTAAYAVSDEYGKVQPQGAIGLGPGGAYSFTVLLQASRLGMDTDGRRYEVTVRATDNAGNGGSKTGVVNVPHDQGR
jgi:virginiamycin B lyase